MAKTTVRGEQITDATVTDADVAAANKDGVAATPSMRTLGAGAQQAAAGTHTHVHNTLTGLTTGDDHTQYAYLAGRAGGQVLYGGTNAGDGLYFFATNGLNGHIELSGSLNLTERITPPQITADQNNYSPSNLHGVFLLRLNTDAARTLTGLVAPISSTIRLLMIENIGAQNLILAHESISSTDVNRFHFSSGTNLTVKADSSIFLFYEPQTGTTGRWRDLAAGAITAHSGLSGLTVGDDHTQYALLAGRVGGQSLSGGTATGNVLTLRGSTLGDGRILIQDGLNIQKSTLSSFGTDQNNYVVAASASTMLRMTTSADVVLTGLDATNHSGQVFWLFNVGSWNITLANESALSLAANRFNFVLSQDFVIKPGGSLGLWYDSTTLRWRHLEETGREIVADGVVGGQSLYGGIGATDAMYIGGSQAGGMVILGGAVLLGSVVTPAQITSNQTDYNPASSQIVSTLRISSDVAGRTISGLRNDFSGNQGRVLYLTNVGAFNIILVHETGTGTWRIKFANSRNFTLKPGVTIQLFYDVNLQRWLLLSGAEEQTEPFPRFYRRGFTWGRTPTNITSGVDIAAGECRSDDDDVNLYTTSTLTKLLSANWAVGSAAGGLDTGARAASTWYHIYIIYNPTTLVTDALLSLSATTPTMPSGYTKKRMIGAIRTGVTNLEDVLVHFLAPGGMYIQYVDPATIGFAINDNTLTTVRKAYTIPHVPPNLGETILMDCMCLFSSATTGTQIWLYDANVTDAAPSNASAPGSMCGILVANLVHSKRAIVTTITGALSARASAASTGLKLQVMGYFWPGGI